MQAEFSGGSFPGILKLFSVVSVQHRHKKSVHHQEMKLINCQPCQNILLDDFPDNVTTELIKKSIFHVPQSYLLPSLPEHLESFFPPVISSSSSPASSSYHLCSTYSLLHLSSGFSTLITALSVASSPSYELSTLHAAISLNACARVLGCVCRGVHAHACHTDAALQGSLLRPLSLQESERQGIQVIVPWSVTVNVLMHNFIKECFRFVTVYEHLVSIRNQQEYIKL